MIVLPSTISHVKNLLRYSVVGLLFLLINRAALAKECSCEASVQIERANGTIEYIDPYEVLSEIPVFNLATGDSVRVHVYFSMNLCLTPVVLKRFNNIALPDEPSSIFMDYKLVDPGYYYFAGTASNIEYSIPVGFIIIQAPTSTLYLRVFLRGAYSPDLGSMRDDLRVNGNLPYFGSYFVSGIFESPQVIWSPLSTAAQYVSGPDAIVDWVRVEFRDSQDPSFIHWVEYACVQRDGDIVQSDGVSPITVILPNEEFYVTVRHHNHLGVMSTSPILLGPDPISIDFTDPSYPTFGSDAQVQIGSVMALWPGNSKYSSSGDLSIKYIGLNDDRDPILQRVGGTVPTTIVSGYYNEDLNLDGVVKYTGANNDRDVILQTIGGSMPTAVRVEQIP